MAIDVRALNFGYRGDDVLRNVTLYAPAGKFIAILGKNGSGKSTLLKLIAGMLEFRSGSISILGQDITRLHRSQRARLIGYLPQFHTPYFPFTVAEVVLTGRASHVFSVPRRQDREIADRAMTEVGIEGMRNRPYTELSGGERHLVMIARVLAQEPRIVLMDEPLSHLDLHNQSRVLNLIRKLTSAGLTVIAVLHDPNTAFAYADEFIFLKDGSLRIIEAGARPWDQMVLVDVYGTPLETIPYKGKALVMLV
ncbi:MAG: ABC transporter ATP-binding protein [Thermodesulfovibrio sp.]|nr:ABC transporter ATP-binding protein [Thermodesulfovibrio sp.]